MVHRFACARQVRERVHVLFAERLLAFQRRRVGFQVLSKDVELRVGPVAAKATGRAPWM